MFWIDLVVSEEILDVSCPNSETRELDENKGEWGKSKKVLFVASLLKTSLLIHPLFDVLYALFKVETFVSPLASSFKLEFWVVANPFE